MRSLDKHHSGPIRCVALSKDERYIATGGDDKKIKVMEAGTFYVHREIKCDSYYQSTLRTTKMNLKKIFRRTTFIKLR